MDPTVIFLHQSGSFSFCLPSFSHYFRLPSQNLRSLFFSFFLSLLSWYHLTICRTVLMQLRKNTCWWTKRLSTHTGHVANGPFKKPIRNLCQLKCSNGSCVVWKKKLCHSNGSCGFANGSCGCTERNPRQPFLGFIKLELLYTGRNKVSTRARVPV